MAIRPSEEGKAAFGQQLREMRQRIVSWDGGTLTQNDLAAQIGCNPTAISQWEKGKRTPSHAQLVKLVKFFAGKMGCLETLERAREWVKPIGESLTRQELAAAFPRACYALWALRGKLRA